MSGMVGGVGDAKEATPEIQEIVMQVKSAAEEKTGRTFLEFTVKSFRSQVVAGMNYFVKVHVGEGDFVHLRVYKNLQKEVSLHGIQEGKTEIDTIEYFS